MDEDRFEILRKMHIRRVPRSGAAFAGNEVKIVLLTVVRKVFSTLMSLIRLSRVQKLYLL
jgi:hypothetical protein